MIIHSLHLLKHLKAIKTILISIKLCWHHKEEMPMEMSKLWISFTVCFSNVFLRTSYKGVKHHGSQSFSK